MANDALVAEMLDLIVNDSDNLERTEGGDITRVG